MSKTYSFSGLGRLFRPAYDNDFDALNPEFWAREAMVEWQSDLVLPPLITTDFSDQVGRWGDVVNIPQLPELKARRKSAPCEEITQSPLESTSFQLQLNQYIYQSFKICDGDENRPKRDLVETYLQPAVRSMAEMLDGIIAAQHLHFWDNHAGHLEGLSAATAEDYVIDLGEVMSLNKVPLRNRSLVLGPRSYTPFLRNDNLVRVDASGSNRALRNGEIGDLYGFNLFRNFGQPHVTSSGITYATALVNGAESAGATTVTIDAATETPTVGEFIVFEGDDIPQLVTATTVAAGAGDVTITPGLSRAIEDNADVKWVSAGALTAAAYGGPTTTPTRYGHAGRIRIDGVVTPPQSGQVTTFGTNTDNIYAIIQVFTEDIDGVALAAGTYEIMLDRPLEAAVADNAAVNLGPAGSFNLAVGQRDALAMAIRPLARPRASALSYVLNYKGYSLRVVISYNAIQQAHIVTIDTLMGISPYRLDAGAVLFG